MAHEPLILVTGGAGFIGSNFVDGLLTLGEHRVRVLDNFVTGLRENIAHVVDRVELVEGDIRELETVDYAVDGVDCIIHLAALPSVSRSVRAPMTTNEVNVGGTLNILSAAHKAGVRRFIMASSSSVYGDSDSLPKTEDLIPHPLSPYAVSKLSGEHYCHVFSRLYGMESIALRFFNIFGPRQDPRSQYSGVISRFITCALEGQPYTVFGDGQQSRDFTYVENAVRACLAAVDAPTLSGEAVNIACGGRVSLLQLVELLNEITGRSQEIVFQDERPGDVKHSEAGLDRAREILGYEPGVCFEEGLRRTYAWYAERRRPR
jgi:UDP-glucose 4-epimerase